MTGRRLAKLTCALSAALASCGWIIDADFDRAYPGPFAAEAPGLGSVTVSDVAVVSRHPGELDLFALAGGELRYYHYDARGGGWSAGVHLATFGYAPRTLCATRNGPRVDVFTGGTGDGAILHHFSTEDVTAWHGPYKLVNTGRVHPASRVAATSFAPGRLDLFWFLESGNLGHAWSWAGDYFWAGTETGDSAELVHLQPLTAADASGSLEAVSLGPGQIDLFFLDASTPRLHRHSYREDTGGWRWTRDQSSPSHLGPEPSPSISLAAAAAGLTEIDVYLQWSDGPTTGLAQARLVDGAWAVPDSARVSLTGHPSQLYDAIQASFR
jgi:hypothetical protein